MTRTMAVHVSYKFFYIFLPSSAQKQREMTKFCIFWGTGTMAANFSYFHYLKLNPGVIYLA